MDVNWTIVVITLIYTNINSLCYKPETNMLTVSKVKNKS